MKKVKMGDRVTSADGVEFTVCGMATFSHEITAAQADIIARVSCMNCGTPHTPVVSPLNDLVKDRAPQDDGGGYTIVWGQ